MKTPKLNFAKLAALFVIGGLAFGTSCEKENKEEDEINSETNSSDTTSTNPSDTTVTTLDSTTFDSVNAGPDYTECINAGGNIQLSGFPEGGTWSGSEFISNSGLFVPTKVGHYHLVYSHGSATSLIADTMLMTVEACNFNGDSSNTNVNETSDSSLINKAVTMNGKLNGIWNLTTKQGGIAGMSTTYSKGQVSWEFISIDGILVIKSSDSLDYFGPAMGIYKYTIEITNGKINLVLDAEKGANNSQAQTFVIDEVSPNNFEFIEAYISDGYTFRFNK
jgi:hypothetical protein